ncbi:MAG: hypothetical protein VX874_15815 [Pseudomonadota bacterium]|nr:hypothetical protein [Pseudomonadota bacterium]
MGRRKYADIVIRGESFPDANAAAKAHKVTPDAVRLAARTGKLDLVGLGYPRIDPTPVLIAGRTFASAADAARAFGKTAHAVWKAINEGDPDRIARKPRHARIRAKPVTLGPLSFPSMREASLQLGFSEGYVSQALRRGSPHARQTILAAAMRLAAQQERKTA